MHFLQIIKFKKFVQFKLNYFYACQNVSYNFVIYTR